jgi:hypothetical protein
MQNKTSFTITPFFAAIFLALLISCSPNVPDDENKGMAVPHGLQLIEIDGMPYDWGGIPELASATAQSTEKLKVAHDSEYLYLSVHGEGMTGYYQFFLDTDDNAGTGCQDNPWSVFGSDYMIENGFLDSSSGPGWEDWEFVGSADVIHAINSDVYEVRVKRSALNITGTVIKVAGREVNSGFAQISILPASGTPPDYNFSTGYDLTGAVKLMKVLIPAYFDPTVNPGDWNRITLKAAEMPDRIFAIANPNNGPGASVNSSYTTTIDTLRSNGGRVLGYVFTLYGSRDINDVKADIDSWYSFYNIDGIFLDEQAIDPGYEDHYLEIRNYIKAKRPAALVVGNPGIIPSETYLFNSGTRIMDVICIFENETGYLEWEAPSWVFNYESDNFCVLTIETPEADQQLFSDYAASNNAGWIYHTDDTLDPNPWDVLTTYFEAMCDYIE